MGEQKHGLYLFCGAVGSGKTFLSSVAAAGLLRKKAEEGSVLFLGYTKQSLLENIAPELNGLGIIDLNDSSKDFLSINKNKIPIFGGYDARRSFALRGRNCSMIVIDELSKVHKEVYLECFRRLRKGKNPCMIATTNPDSPTHWLYEEIFEKKPSYAKVMHFTMDDNPGMSEDYKNKLKEQYKYTPFLYDRFILGKWVTGAGQIYDFTDNIKEDAEIEEELERFWEKNIHFIWGIDFGMRNPTALINIQITPDKNVFIADEIFLDNAKEHMTLTGLSQIIAEKCRKGSIAIDPSALVLKEEILINHSNLTVVETDNAVIDGVRVIQNLSRTKKLHISKRCKNLIREAENYSWKEATETQDKETVVKKDDHCLDALRYAIGSASYALKPSRGKERVGEISDYVYRRSLF